MISTSDTLVTLRAGDAMVDLAPAIGGAVARFRWRDIELFRPATAEAIGRGEVLGMGSFPLVPFAGRIRNGRFGLDGRVVRLPVNLAGETDAIHGHGWQARWAVVAADQTHATLRFDHAAGAWPWDYRAEQTFALTDSVLTHSLIVTNRASEPMPAGLGLHPYFPRRPGASLSAQVDGVFLFPDQPPTPAPEVWDWTRGQAIDAFVDNQFTGWDGRARVVWPDRRLSLTLESEPASRHLVVYAPTGEDYFCVEPVSHQLDAVNRSSGGIGHGMASLAPGESLSLTVRFALRSLT